MTAAKSAHRSALAVCVGTFMALAAVALAPSAQAQPDLSGIARRLGAITGRAGAVGGPPVIAIAASPRTIPPPVVQDYLDALTLMESAGGRGTVANYTWKSLEPQPGVFQLDQLRDDMNFTESRGYVNLLVVQTINTVKREVPADLEALSWDDPRMIARFDALLTALAPVVGSRAAYLSLGNEVDVYLASTGQWQAYTRFLASATARVRQVLPAIQLGVTTTYDGLMAGHGASMAQLNQVMDVTIMTYYPLTALRVRPPQVASTDFADMLRFAGGRPLVLQEVGYPADPLNGSSEVMQADFMRYALVARSQAARRIPFMSLFLLHDIPEEQCTQLSQYYGLPSVAEFRAFLCSLGLRRADGTPRLAWDVVRTAGNAQIQQSLRAIVPRSVAPQSIVVPQGTVAPQVSAPAPRASTPRARSSRRATATRQR